MLLINARSEHVKEEIREVYEPDVGDGVLEVFCVSNTSYEKFARKGDAEMVLASGIPEVRRFCYTITAHAQQLQAIHFLVSKLPSLLNSAELRAAKPTAQPLKARLDKAINRTLEDVETEVCNSHRAMLHRLTAYGIHGCVAIQKRFHGGVSRGDSYTSR
jgi:hypothetical protein